MATAYLAALRAMVPFMSQSLDRPLALNERLKLRLHLLVCAWCSRYFKQISFLRRLMRIQAPMPASDNPPSFVLTAAARERIANFINQHARHNQ